MASSTGTVSAAINLSALQWNVQYLVDQSQADQLGDSQFFGPRDVRGMATYNAGNGQIYIYAGYNNKVSPSSTPGGVRRIDVTGIDNGLYNKLTDPHQPSVDYTAASIQLQGVRGKGIAVDDKGRVYLAEGPNILVYNADLDTLLFTISDSSITKTEGVAVVREGMDLVLYSSDRTNQTLVRHVIQEGVGNAVTGAVLSGLDGNDGVMTITSNSGGLRGVGVDPNGKIWVADVGDTSGPGNPTNGQILRINPTTFDIDSLALTSPMDVEFVPVSYRVLVNGVLVARTGVSAALVTQYTQNTIAVLDADAALGALALEMITPSPDYTGMFLDPDGNGSPGIGALSGIAFTQYNGKEYLWVANEHGQTEDERSRYGIEDGASGLAGAQFFKDLLHDDNDPILVFHNPEPTTISILAIGGLMLASRRKTR